MSKPSAENQLPDFSGQSKIMFYSEGNPAAMLVTNRAGRRKSSTMTFATAEAALAWCRHSGAMMVYCPVALDRN